jgi:hypothetical protein
MKVIFLDVSTEGPEVEHNPIQILGSAPSPAKERWQCVDLTRGRGLGRGFYSIQGILQIDTCLIGA